MAARVLACLLLFWCCVGAPPLTAGGWGHSPPQWRQLGRGLSFAEIQVKHDEEVVETLAVVRVDPVYNAFRVFHHTPQSIAAWQKELAAPLVFNASFYDKEGRPCGLILSNDTILGPLRNPQMRGMFVAEPKGMSPDLPRATILDLIAAPINPRNLPWSQGVQSFPLLLDSKGRVRVRNSDKTAQRTVIATDRHGNILVINTTDRYFNLYNLARFLKDSSLEIDTALNLDGGLEAQLYIKTKEVEYLSPSAWRTRLGNLLDQKQFWLPTVVAVFPRQD